MWFKSKAYKQNDYFAMKSEERYEFILKKILNVPNKFYKPDKGFIKSNVFKKLESFIDNNCGVNVIGFSKIRTISEDNISEKKLSSKDRLNFIRENLVFGIIPFFKDESQISFAMAGLYIGDNYDNMCNVSSNFLNPVAQKDNCSFLKQEAIDYILTDDELTMPKFERGFTIKRIRPELGEMVYAKCGYDQTTGKKCSRVMAKVSFPLMSIQNRQTGEVRTVVNPIGYQALLEKVPQHIAGRAIEIGIETPINGYMIVVGTHYMRFDCKSMQVCNYIDYITPIAAVPISSIKFHNQEVIK